MPDFLKTQGGQIGLSYITPTSGFAKTSWNECGDLFLPLQNLLPMFCPFLKFLQALIQKTTDIL